jgi:hypothetical protein
MTTPPPSELVALAVTTDLMPDGTYAATCSLGEDVAWTLPPGRAAAYSNAVDSLATAAEHDAAVYAALRCKGLPQDLIAAVLLRCRSHRPSTDRWTAPLVITAGITLREPHGPFLIVRHPDRPDLDWQWTPQQAREHASHVINVCAAAILDSTLSSVLAELGVDAETIPAVVDHVGRHWPGDTAREQH